MYRELVVCGELTMSLANSLGAWSKSESRGGDRENNL
jgi:hypothetical protein